MNKRLLWCLLFGARGGDGVTYLLRDEFTTDDAAPLTSPRTSEPGPGTLTVVEASNGAAFSITGGQLQIVGSGASYNHARIVSGALDRTIGRMLAMTYTPDAATFPRGYYGWVDNDANARQLVVGNDPRYTIINSGSSSACLDTSVLTRTVGLILRSSGGFVVQRVGADWTLRYVYNSGNLDPIYVGAYQYDANPMLIDYWRVADLAAPWDTDYGFVTQRLAGARAPGDTFTHEADCLIEFTVQTLPTVDQIELRFRIQDANNYWQVTVDSAGDLDLDEIVAGVPAQRGTYVAAIVNGARVEIVCDDETIQVYNGSNAQRISYALAANFKTETDGELETESDGAVTDIVTWPRHLTGSALSEVTNVIPT